MAVVHLARDHSRADSATVDRRRCIENAEMPNKAIQPMTAPPRLAEIRESGEGQSWLILVVVLRIKTLTAASVADLAKQSERA